MSGGKNVIHKHYHDMTIKERRAVIGRLTNIRGLNHLGEHAKKRMKERNISEYDIYSVFKNYNLVEFSKESNDIRAVLKCRKPNENGKIIQIVMSLITGEIITCTQEANIGIGMPNMDRYYGSGKLLDISSFIGYYRPLNNNGSRKYGYFTKGRKRKNS